MTVREVTTITCDACTKTQAGVGARFSNRCPDRWAEISLDYRDMSEDKQVYEEWHLCPDCTGELILSIVNHAPGRTDAVAEQPS